MQVQLHTASDGYVLTIQLAVQGEVRQIRIPEIDASHVLRLLDSLQIHSNYCIAAGFTDHMGNFEVLPLGEFHLLRSSLTVNGVSVRGTAVCVCDWGNLFGAPGNGC